jgi:hypothetical protein
MIREASPQSMQNILHFAPLLPNRQRFIEQFQNMYGMAQRFLQIHRKQHATPHHPPS